MQHIDHTDREGDGRRRSREREGEEQGSEEGENRGGDSVLQVDNENESFRRMALRQIRRARQRERRLQPQRVRSEQGRVSVTSHFIYLSDIVYRKSTMKGWPSCIRMIRWLLLMY